MAVSFSPDGKFVVTGERSGTAKLWNVESGLEMRTLKGSQGGLVSLCFNPDGNILVINEGDLVA